MDFCWATLLASRKTATVVQTTQGLRFAKLPVQLAEHMEKNKAKNATLLLLVVPSGNRVKLG